MVSGTPPGGEAPAGSRGPIAPAPSRPRRWRVLAGIVAGCGFAALALLAGFGAFLLSLDRSERDPSEVADGIVALTGGAGRIEDAVELLAKGFGGRLLITGVNERTSREAIKRLSPGQRELVECCIDLDYRARNTVGNAAEISRWVREKGFRSLIVVTSYYHVPRALAELDEVLPDIRKLPYAVIATRPLQPLGATFVRARILVSEYLKFVVASVRLRVAEWLVVPAHTAARRAA